MQNRNTLAEKFYISSRVTPSFCSGMDFSLYNPLSQFSPSSPGSRVSATCSRWPTTTHPLITCSSSYSRYTAMRFYSNQSQSKQLPSVHPEIQLSSSYFPPGGAIELMPLPIFLEPRRAARELPRNICWLGTVPLALKS